MVWFCVADLQSSEIELGFVQMTTAIAIEDVRREVKILKSLSGHNHLVKFYDAYEDSNNVYIVMEYVFLVLAMSV